MLACAESAWHELALRDRELGGSLVIVRAWRSQRCGRLSSRRGVQSCGLPTKLPASSWQRFRMSQFLPRLGAPRRGAAGGGRHASAKMRNQFHFWKITVTKKLSIAGATSQSSATRRIFWRTRARTAHCWA